MAVASTTAFNLTIAEIIEEAAARIGGQPILGQEYVSAMRIIDLILADWSNRGIMLYTLEQIQVTLSVSTSSYTLETDAQDVYQAVVRVSGTDYTINRISYDEYLDIPNKSNKGRPTQFFIDRQRDAPVLHVWPLPTSTTTTFKYWKIRYTKDSNTLRNNADVHRRYLPALVSGLAYYMALRRPNIQDATKSRLKMLYDEEIQRAFEEDRERTTFSAKPRFSL